MGLPGNHGFNLLFYPSKIKKTKDRETPCEMRTGNNYRPENTCYIVLLEQCTKATIRVCKDPASIILNITLALMDETAWN